MRTITVLNAKGGCGKTTIATCLASHLADTGYAVGLADYDPQRGATDWLAARPADAPPIHGYTADNGGGIRPASGTQVLVVDSPAATHGRMLSNLVRRTDSLILPVLPSPIDMRAVHRFLEELYSLKQIDEKATRVGLVANRVKENTIIYRDLSLFLGRLKVPFVARLRDTQNYNRAAQRGIGVMDLPPYLASRDHEQWQPLLRWLRSKHSMPLK